MAGSTPLERTPTADVLPEPHHWTFLTNHAHILLLISRDPTIRLRDLAVTVGITERSAQRIVSDLVEAGYLTRQRLGRRNSYDIHPELPFRHPVEQRNSVGSLLVLLGGDPAASAP